MDEEEEFGELGGEEDIKVKDEPRSEAGEQEVEEEEEEEGEEEKGMEEDINVTDSQVMIQLKEAEEEAEALRKEITALRCEIDDYQCRGQLTEEDAEHLQDLQLQLMEKVALLDELTKRIAKLMELAKNIQKEDEETTILEEEEEETLPDDLLPRVVICSSWDDMMPKVVVCCDMKKPGVTKKSEEDDRDENGLTPEQREALEKERRCMAEERNRLQYQIACLEGEMRVMMRENDMLSKKVVQLKSDLENQPPFEFEMSVSATNPPGCGGPKPGNMDMGYGVMGPPGGGPYTVGAALTPGSEYQGTVTVAPPPPQFFPGMYPNQYNDPQMQQMQPSMQPTQPNGNGGKQLPCGGMTGIPGKSVPCPRLQEPQPVNDWTSSLPPYGKKCRKDFNAAQGGCGNCCGGNGGISEDLLNTFKPQPMDVNFKVNVQPQTGAGGGYRPGGNGGRNGSMDTDARSNKIAQQLQEIEAELRRMQRDLCKAKNDKETLKAQQATLNCVKNFLM